VEFHGDNNDQQAAPQNMPSTMVAEMMPFTKPSLFESFFIYKNICLSYITSGTKKKIPERKTNSITTGAESIFLN